MTDDIQVLFNNFFDKTTSNFRIIGDSDLHLMTIFSIALEIKAKNILELGVRSGDTTEPLLCAAAINDGKLTSVDIQEIEWKCPDSLKCFWNPVKSEAIHYLNDDSDSYYDLIYVDDLHTYYHVKTELDIISKKIDSRSVILLHDLMTWSDPNYFQPDTEKHNGTEWDGGGPYKAVSELDTSIWEWSTIPSNNGLTILRKRGEILHG